RTRCPPRRALESAGRAAPGGARPGCPRRASQVPRSWASGVTGSGGRSPPGGVVSAAVVSDIACSDVVERSVSSGVRGDGLDGGTPPTGRTGSGRIVRLRSLSTSSSSCSWNWRAMARALPTQRPTSRTTRGNFSGPSTMSAKTKMTRISENPMSNMKIQPWLWRMHPDSPDHRDAPARLVAASDPPRPTVTGSSGAALALGSRLGLRCGFCLRKLSIGAVRGNLSAGGGGLFLVALVHRLLEAAHGMAQILTDASELLGAKDDEHHDQDDQQLLHFHKAWTPLRLRVREHNRDRIIG